MRPAINVRNPGIRDLPGVDFVGIRYVDGGRAAEGRSDTVQGEVFGGLSCSAPSETAPRPSA